MKVIDKIEIIASFTTDVGSWNEAAVMEQEVLDKRRRILGEEHPSTISAMNNPTLFQDMKKTRKEGFLKRIFKSARGRSRG